jgi:hypothetical protein
MVLAVLIYWGIMMFRRFIVIWLAFMVVYCCTIMWRDGIGTFLMFVNGVTMTFLYLFNFHNLSPYNKRNEDRDKMLLEQSVLLDRQTVTMRNQNDQLDKLVALRKQQDLVMKMQKQRIAELEVIR